MKQQTRVRYKISFRCDGLTVINTEKGEEIGLRIEQARTHDEQCLGLMFRTSLPEDAGMLFDFDPPEYSPGIWMKNTFIPLDILWIDEEGVIRRIRENAEPLTTNLTAWRGWTRYILEVNAGFARKYDIQPGARLNFKPEKYA
jgi:uncharacterized protein